MSLPFPTRFAPSARLIGFPFPPRATPSRCSSDRNFLRDRRPQSLGNVTWAPFGLQAHNLLRKTLQEMRMG